MTKFFDNVFGAHGIALTLYEVYEVIIFGGNSL